jgi:hypothetical protein
MALRNRSQRRCSGCWGDISTRDGLGQGQTVTLVWRLRRRWESWLSTTHIFLLPYPLGQLGTGGPGNDQDPG